MNFFKSFSITFITTILLTIFGILNNVVITRQIGADGRGQYAVIMNFVLLLSLLFGEGIRRSNTILIGNNKNYFVDLVKKSLIVFLFLLFLLLTVSLNSDILNFLLPNISSKLIVLAALSVSFYIFWQSIQALFLGIQEIVFFNILQVSSISISLFLNIVGIYLFDFGLIEIIYVYLGATIITAAVAFWGLRKPYKRFGRTSLKVNFFEMLNLGSRSVVAGLFSFTIYKSGIFFANYYLDTVQTGLYSIALLFFEIMQKLPNTIGTLVLSRTAADSSSSNSDNTERLVRAMLFIDLIFLFVLALLGKVIIVIVFGIEFVDSVNLLMYLFPSLFFIGPASVLYAYFMGKGYPKKIIILNAIAAVSTVILLFLFINSSGITVVPIITSAIISIWTLVLMVFFVFETKTSFRQLLFITKADIQYLISSVKSLLGRS